MAKKSKRPVFDESDSDGDGTNNGNSNGFEEYLKEKSEQSNKRARSSKALEAAASGLQDESPEVNRTDEKSTKPTFINGLLESKRQRELDKLHSHSIRTRLENELHKKSGSNEETFVTEGYKERRKDYDNAELLAAEEQKQDDDRGDRALYVGSSRSMALRVLMSEQPHQEDSQRRKDQVQPGEDVVKKPVVFENDIYRVEQFKMSTSSSAANELVQESMIKLRPEEKELCVCEFLRSTVSAQEIEKHIEKYNERHQQPV